MSTAYASSSAFHRFIVLRSRLLSLGPVGPSAHTNTSNRVLRLRLLFGLVRHSLTAAGPSPWITPASAALSASADTSSAFPLTLLYRLLIPEIGDPDRRFSFVIRLSRRSEKLFPQRPWNRNTAAISSGVYDVFSPVALGHGIDVYCAHGPSSASAAPISERAATKLCVGSQRYPVEV